MKTTATTAAALLMILAAAAQTQPDTTNITIGDKKIMLIDPTPDKDTTRVDMNYDEDEEGGDYGDHEHKLELTHWGGVDLGMNMLLTKDNKTTLDSADQWLTLDNSRSLSWRINLFEEKIRLYKDYVGLIIGAGFTYNSYGLKKNVNIMVMDTTGKTFGQIDSIHTFSKNKLRASYLNVPLMLEFNTSDDNEHSFHVAAGVIGGWNMGSITRQKWDTGSDKYNLRKKGDYNLTPFTADLSVRIGYKNFTVFATYGLTPLFQKNKGPEVYPMTVGLQIAPF